jgi:signal transduction histidine kinase
LNILCVDDESRVRDLLTMLLEPEFDCVYSAANAKEAIIVFDNYKPEIVISDIRMPGEDGIELLAKIKKNSLDTEVLIMSGHGDLDSAISSLHYGASEFLTKPVDARKLIHIIKQIKEKIILRKENREYKELLEHIVKKRTEQLLESEKMAIIGRHSAHLAHNLNTSLTTILGGIQFMAIKQNMDAETLKKYINKINAAAIQMKDTISNTLLRIRKDSIKENVEIDLNEVILKQVEFYKSNCIVPNDVHFELNLDKKLSLFTGVYSDFTQIFDNLISNSMDALEAVEEKKIIIMTYSNDSQLCFKVIDNGIGIKADNIRKIFDANFTTKEIGKGTGIGLASVKELLYHYKANITVDSEPNVYTEFKVELNLD